MINVTTVVSVDKLDTVENAAEDQLRKYRKGELSGIELPVMEIHDRSKDCLSCKLDLGSCIYFECGKFKSVHF